MRLVKKKFHWSQTKIPFLSHPFHHHTGKELTANSILFQHRPHHHDGIDELIVCLHARSDDNIRIARFEKRQLLTSCNPLKQLCILLLLLLLLGSNRISCYFKKVTRSSLGRDTHPYVCTKPHSDGAESIVLQVWKGFNKLRTLVRDHLSSKDSSALSLGGLIKGMVNGIPETNPFWLNMLICYRAALTHTLSTTLNFFFHATPIVACSHRMIGKIK